MDRTYATQEEREDYTKRLAEQAIKIMSREAPAWIGSRDEFWLNMAQPDRDLVRALGLFERGEIDKETVDKAALLYLAAARQEIQRCKRKVEHGTGKAD